MQHLGIKLTHDAAVALVEDGKLIFSIEAEKINNNARHSKWDSLEQAIGVAQVAGFNMLMPYTISIDGWKDGVLKSHGNMRVSADISNMKPCIISANAFVEGSADGIPYVSYQHAYNHASGSVAMSPFAGQTCACLMWDGSGVPRIYLIYDGMIDQVAEGFLLNGLIYNLMGYYFGPMKVSLDEASAIQKEGKVFGKRDWSGKLMSYASLGSVDEDLVSAIRILMSGAQQTNVKGYFEHNLLQRIAFLQGDLSDATMLRSIERALGDELIAFVASEVSPEVPVVFTGGSALNIKWNSALRRSREQGGFWVPPCPNDSGSAIGAAVSSYWEEVGIGAPIQWSVYCGPEFIVNAPVPRWRPSPMTAFEFGSELSDGRPSLCFHGRAEIGPRALGHRSILCSPVDKASADLINKIKRREWWRPVAPLAVESIADEYFTPGTPDRFMLFDHKATEQCKADAPAIVHVDDTARLQTVSGGDCMVTSTILLGFTSRTGVPVLCNTSANNLGSGFFPDLNSAMVWAEKNGIKRIWCDGTVWNLWE